MDIKKVLNLFFGNSVELKILRFLMKHDYKGMYSNEENVRYSARKIASFISENHSTCLKKLKTLEENNIVKRENIANSFQFSLKQNAYTQFLASIIEQENFENRIFDKIRNHFINYSVEALIVFGSYSKFGTATSESDLDICFVFKQKSNINNFLEQNTLFFDKFLADFLIRIEPLCVSKSEFKPSVSVYKTILREGLFLIGDRKHYG
tara:strand:+ start:4198 stop:4821 length:624 start_codon:yes stop_codon:yes gene_type:complete